jgi:hypothetical protein
MARMILSKVELAQAFQVSTQAIDGWLCHGCPRLAGGVPGVKCQFVWNDVEDWAYQYKTWPNYGDPDMVIGSAYHRALAIVKARPKPARRKRC